MTGDERPGPKVTLQDAAARIATVVMQQATPAAQLRELKRQIAQLAEEDRWAVELIVTVQARAMNDQNSPELARQGERRVTAIVGAVFLLLCLAIALAVPEPSQFQEKVFTIVLGLAGAAVGMILTGSIEIRGERPGLKVQAAGALGLGVFVILIYRFIL